MKRLIRFMLVSVIIAATPPARAQDGWFSLASPPIVVRIDDVNDKVNFTNTSGKNLQGLTVHVRDANGRIGTRVIAARIKPHQTVVIASPDLPPGFLQSSTTFTCSDYSKPLKLKYP